MNVPVPLLVFFLAVGLFVLIAVPLLAGASLARMLGVRWTVSQATLDVLTAVIAELLAVRLIRYSSTLRPHTMLWVALPLTVLAIGARYFFLRGQAHD